MSRADHSRLRTALDNPLVGDDSRYTAAALGYIVLVVTGIVLDDLLARGAVDALPGVLDSPVEGFIGALIFVLVVTSIVVPAAYGLVNGGPVVAAAIALVPQFAIAAVTWQWLLTNDLLVALLGAGAGAIVAVAHLLYRERQRREPPAGLVDGLLFATALTVVATAGAVRLGAGGPPVPGASGDWLWVAAIPVAGCLACWLLAVRVWGVGALVDAG